MYKETLRFLEKTLGVELLEENIDGNNIIVKTCLLNIGVVTRELYTCGFSNMVITIVDASNVQIITENSVD